MAAMWWQPTYSWACAWFNGKKTQRLCVCMCELLMSHQRCVPDARLWFWPHIFAPTPLECHPHIRVKQTQACSESSCISMSKKKKYRHIFWSPSSPSLPTQVVSASFRFFVGHCSNRNIPTHTHTAENGGVMSVRGIDTQQDVLLCKNPSRQISCSSPCAK